MKRAALVTLLLLGGCKFSPLMNKIEVGDEPFVVLVGEGADGRADLFAVAAGGGAMIQVTFTNGVEAAPQLTPDGALVAYLRMRDTLPTTPREVVVMNLLSGAERRLALPDDAGRPERLGWSDDQRTLYVATDRGQWALAAPPATDAPRPTNAGVADSALTTWLGTPRFARAITCATGGVCVLTARGDTTTLAPTGRDPFRWGSDSVAWFEGERLMVRSLGPGLPRRVEWTRAPGNARDGSYAAGLPKASSP